MNTDSRTERIAAGLEKRFEDCSSVLRDCLGTAQQSGGYSHNQLQSTALFLRTSAQIAGVIARLEALAARDKAGGAENRGSIP